MNITKQQKEEVFKKTRIVRRHIIEMTAKAASGHPGGSLSATDILCCLYFYKMKYDVSRPEWEDRDRFILSKGHAAPALYATLAEAGFFPTSYLKTLRQVGSSLQGHPDMLSLPGIEMTTGSLGQGLSVGVGMCLGARVDKKNYKVYVVIGDGESQEGQIWEAAMAAGHYKLNNLVVILDRNQFQIDGRTENIMGIEPVADKWKAFRFNVIKNVNGHCIDSLTKALDNIPKNDKPTIIIANTIKGKGVSFMECNNEFHGKAPKKDEVEKALKEL